MIDQNLLRSNPVYVEEMLKRRYMSVEVKEFLRMDQERKIIQVETERLQEQRNKLAKEIGTLKAKGSSAEELIQKASLIPKEIGELSEKLNLLQRDIHSWISRIPNLPSEDVLVGKDETGNKVLRLEGKPTVFDFQPLDHVEIGEKHGLDFETASKISGSRFSISFGKIAKLHRALANFMLDIQTNQNGYEEYSVPVVVNQDAMYGTGQLPKFEEDLFRVIKGGSSDNGHKSFLIPTAEVPLTNLISGKILAEDILPLKFTALTCCFRSEAGSYGKDTRGLMRQHQFEKVELVNVTKPSESESSLDMMLSHAEIILKKLELPYRVVQLCTGDMGFSARKTYDIEVWIPSQQTYREISSCSNCGDFQARRINARFKSMENGKAKNLFVHTLNGSGLAVGRCLIAVLENFQNSDGSVNVPEVLQCYMGGLKKITSK